VSLAICAITASGLSATAMAPHHARVFASAAVRPLLRVASTGVRMQEFPTLEDELKEGKITQEEYDQLTEGISEDEYEAELSAQAQAEEAEMSAEAAKIVKGMTSASGVEFAPWMKVDAEAIAKAKKEREARKARQAASALKSDSMLIDPQAAELGAGGGLKSKVLSDEEVELRWDTTDEAGNAGFIVQRRRGGKENFEDLESYEIFSPLRSKGPDGGSYVYLDDTAAVGTWVYRILDCDTSGTRSAVCQKLVEIEDKDEQQFTVVVGVAALALALVAVIAGVLTDPIQTTQNGRSVF